MAVNKKAEAAEKTTPSKKTVAPSGAKKTATTASAAKVAGAKKAVNKMPAVAKKVAAKKAVAKKTVAKKAPVKKAAATAEDLSAKAPAKKASAKKAPAKKPVTKTAVTKTAVDEATSSKAAAEMKTSRAPASTAPAPTDGPAKECTPEKRERLKKRAATLPVRPDEDAWSPAELADVYRELRADHDRLEAEITAADSDFADLLWSPGDGAGDDQADAGSRTFEREHEMSLAANARDMLAQTERAMERIADGTYGVCEGCGNPIGKARLQAYPRATLCVSCKQREERR